MNIFFLSVPDNDLNLTVSASFAIYRGLVIPHVFFKKFSSILRFFEFILLFVKSMFSESINLFNKASFSLSVILAKKKLNDIKLLKNLKIKIP